jgi:hypothetical protein
VKTDAAALAEAAKVFKAPTAITAVERGNTYPELRAVFPQNRVLERTSMSSWDDQNVRGALAANKRKQLVEPGLWREVCDTTFALSIAKHADLRDLQGGRCLRGAAPRVRVTA